MRTISVTVMARRVGAIGIFQHVRFLVDIPFPILPSIVGSMHEIASDHARDAWYRKYGSAWEKGPLPIMFKS